MNDNLSASQKYPNSNNDALRMLTFDIEEWFHILDHPTVSSDKKWKDFDYRLEHNMDKLLEVLERNNQSATFFCLGWVAETFPHIIKKLDNLGYEIATHSHKHELVYEQSIERFREDLHKSIVTLEDITGKKVRAYRAPGFSLKESNRWAFEVLIEEGIEIDCSIFPAKRAHGGFKNFGTTKPVWIKTSSGIIKEFPMSIKRFMFQDIVYSGGGYFRFFPYCIIQMFLQKSNYVMTYLHPHDFDCNHPIIDDLPYFRKMKVKIGKKSAIEKLENMIQEFKFIDLDTANKMINWSEVDIISLPERRKKQRLDDAKGLKI